MSDLDRICTALRTCVAAPRCIEVASGDAQLAPGSFRGHMARPTVILCVSGRADYQVARDGKAVDICLNRGELLAIHRGAAISVRPHQSYRSLLIGIDDDHIHSHIAVHRSQPGRVPETWPRLFHAARVLRPQAPSAALRLGCSAFFASLEDYDYIPAAGILAHALLNLLAIELVRPVDATRAVGQRRFHAAKAWVDERFTHSIDRDEVASVIGVDPAHVSRLFRRYAGCTFNAYLWRRRMDLARELLRDPRLDVAEVAAACGCPDANYFSRRFRNATALAPSLWAAKQTSKMRSTGGTRRS